MEYYSAKKKAKKLLIQETGMDFMGITLSYINIRTYKAIHTHTQMNVCENGEST